MPPTWARKTVVAAAGIILLGCPPPFYVQPAAARTLQVPIARAAFGPMPGDARVGDEIEWINRDIVDHTVTARDGRFDVVVPSGKSVRVVLRRSGDTEIYCRYHPGMTAQLTVAR